MNDAYPCLQLDRDEYHATLWLNRPERHNALDGELIAELHHAIDTLSQEAGLRAIVIAGRGESFCAGGDLQWMRRQAQASYEVNLQDARALAYMLRSLAQCKKPTIARVHGAALGGGCGLIAACDVAIASRDAVFGLTEARLGLTPSTIAPYVLAAMGDRAARRCFITGERFDALEAQRLRLVHEVVAADQLDERLRSTLAAVNLGGPQAQEHCKWLLAELRGVGPMPERLEETARSLASIRVGEEAREGIEAFLAHRKPSWAR
jgi:methylglutaconyl-CoA hydratase